VGTHSNAPQSLCPAKLDPSGAPRLGSFLVGNARTTAVIGLRGPVAVDRQGLHHYHMGISGNRPSIKPDLFSALQPPDTVSPPTNTPKSLPSCTTELAAAASPSYALPTNLPSALRHLDENQLDRLLVAVLAERKARGSKKLSLSDGRRHKKRTKEVALPLAQGKLNAVRAAFNAGVRPSRIARECGISQSDVRRALANDEKK
jgi:hypothetical protein